MGVQGIGERFGWSDPVASVGCSRGEHEEIVSVEVDGVCGEGEVVDYEADGAVGAEIVDVPLGEEISMREESEERDGTYLRVIRIRGIPGVGQEENGCVVITAERYTVHCPKRIAKSILSERDIDFLGDGRFRIGGNRKPWDGLVERILEHVRACSSEKARVSWRPYVIAYVCN